MNPEPLDPDHQMALALEEARHRRDEGNIPGAAARYHRARTLAEQVESPEALATILAEAGHMYQQEFDVVTARRYYEEAIQAFHRAGSVHEEALTRFKLGQVEQLAGDLEAAERQLRTALAGLVRLQERRGEGLTRATLGQLLWDQDRPEEGVPELVRGLTLLRDAGAAEAEHVRDHIRYWSHRLGRVRYLELIRAATADPELRALLE
ncbi:MAG: tetratricopeptide repeat protein [Armatimonadetes bacterium]|nr:tetratricopeptide repeat protein [Armatimonadota bacterium]